MIARLQGMIIDRTDHTITIDISGIGFLVWVAKAGAYKLDQKVNMLVHLHWHQDQGPQLFGFEHNTEKHVFNLIMSCSGLGPKIALSVLSSMTPGVFASAIIANDVKALSRVDGIGTKKAESMIVHLRDKVAKLLESGSLISETKTLEILTKVNEVLTSLGYSKIEVVKTVDYLQKTSEMEHAPFDELIRKGLSFAAKNLKNS